MTADTTTVVQSLIDASGLPITRDDQDGIYAVGRLFYEREDYQRAADVFRLLALLVPERSRSWTSLAACHEAFGDSERARALYALALEVPETDSHRAVAAMYKARLDLEAGDSEAAESALEAFDADVAEPAIVSLAADLRSRIGSASCRR